MAKAKPKVTDTKKTKHVSKKRDEACPQIRKVSKWLKVMDYKKKIFALEDQIDKLSEKAHEETPAGK
ncbi:MAG: hypothetical protein ABIB11_02590 [Candidatus Omnitrophota bacterium]